MQQVIVAALRGGAPPRRAACFMQKNDVFISTASGYGTEGEAVFPGNPPVFVPFCIEGEQAEIKVLAVKGGAAYGRGDTAARPRFGIAPAPSLAPGNEKEWKRELLGQNKLTWTTRNFRFTGPVPITCKT